MNQFDFGFISKDDSKTHGFSTEYIAIKAIKYKKFRFYYILDQLTTEDRKLWHRSLFTLLGKIPLYRDDS